MRLGKKINVLEKRLRLFDGFNDDSYSVTGNDSYSARVPSLKLWNSRWHFFPNIQLRKKLPDSHCFFSEQRFVSLYDVADKVVASLIDEDDAKHELRIMRRLCFHRHLVLLTWVSTPGRICGYSQRGGVQA